MKQQHKGVLATLAVIALGWATTRLLQPQTVAATDAGTGFTLDVFPENSRMSFHGKLSTGNTEGTTISKILTTFDPVNGVFSTSSAQLINGDTLYYVSPTGETVSNQVGFTNTTLPDNQIPLISPLSSGVDIADTTTVYNQMTGDIKLVFTPAADTSAGGLIQFLFPMDPSVEASFSADTNYRTVTPTDAQIAAAIAHTADGIPDAGGFDVGLSGVLPSISVDEDDADTSYGTWNCNNTSTARTGAYVRVGKHYYHALACTYTGTTPDTIKALTFTIKGLINPAPAEHTAEEELNRSAGSMDAYAIRANQYDYDTSTSTLGTWLRSANTYVGYSNGVKMTVRVMPQLTFSIEGIAQGQKTACNLSTGTNVATSAYAVPFGSISNTNFTDAAQKIKITTNAPHGYVITAISDDQMGIDGVTCEGYGDLAYCIPGHNYKASGDTGTTDATAWTGEETDPRGFGYTLAVVKGDTYLSDVKYQTTETVPNVRTAFVSDATANLTENDIDASMVDVDDGETKASVLTRILAANSQVSDTGWRAFADRQKDDTPIQIVTNQRSTNGDELDVCYRIRSSTANAPGDYQTTLTYTVTASF